MFVGHYAVSYAVTGVDRRISLGLLFVAVQAVDVAWAVLAGVEKVRIIPGITASNPLDLYYMPLTHSLLATGVWCAAAVTALVAYFVFAGVAEWLDRRRAPATG